MATSKINVTTLLDDIPENLPIGTPVAELSLTGPADGTVSYALISANVTESDKFLSLDNSFKIEGSKIVTTAQIDYEPMALLGLHIVIAAIAYVDGIEIDRKLVPFDISDVLEIHRGTSKFDQLAGTVGMDKIFAGAGNDMLLGYDGNDTLHGGLGQDILTGGAGADIFLFRSIKESTVKAPDVITDWHHVTGDPIRDLIDLRTIDANTKAAGNQSFTWIGTKSFTGHAGELRYEKLKSETYVYADVNGDRKADFAIHFDDAVKLYKADFLL